MVFQNYALYPHMTVHKNMAFGLKLRGRRRPRLSAHTRGRAKMLGIDASARAQARELSGGQRQRVALGRAIVRQPQAFLFDEPLSNLDAKLRVQMRAELERLHLASDDDDLCDARPGRGDDARRAHRGHGRRRGAAGRLAAAIYARPANRFVAAFIGTPPMNFFDGDGARTARSRSRASRFRSGTTRTCLPTRGSG